ncbi:hypothetical protein RHGRI_020246 [Rhododendron griersonianum]|uniref:Uncharacterized protein n=1 Tax=Rhododendron griersonianum TaxID=479676 RepID=A0AAV6JJV0_9ERIC|nr:hypothetical protein RHGRI_020246 [Rhododendron griersonianum]
MAPHSSSPSTIISALLIAVTFIPISSSLPFIMLHGVRVLRSELKVSGLLAMKFVDVRLWRLVATADDRAVELSKEEIGDGSWDSWFMPLRDQAEEVCDKVVNLHGHIGIFSYPGNVIGRGVVEFCDGGPPVKNFVSLGGPHAGTASVPLCGAHLAPSGYLKLPNNIPAYLEKCRFLPKLNNELPDERNATYKERFTSLQNLVLIMFEHDTVLIPKETAWFGYYPEGAFDPVMPPQQEGRRNQARVAGGSPVMGDGRRGSPLTGRPPTRVAGDWAVAVDVITGARVSLDDAGRVKYVSVPGNHLGISSGNAQKYIVPYLEDNASEKYSHRKFGDSGVPRVSRHHKEKQHIHQIYDKESAKMAIEGSSHSWPASVSSYFGELLGFADDK